MLNATVELSVWDRLEAQMQRDEAREANRLLGLSQTSSPKEPTALVHGSVNLLPDSRCRSARGTKHHSVLGECEPVHCVNCGCLYGYVPVENITFTAWICAECEPKFGHLFDTCGVPDIEFEKKAQQAILEKYGAALTPLQFLKELDDPGSVVSKLLKDFEATLIR